MIVTSIEEDRTETQGWFFPRMFPFDLAYKKGALPDTKWHSHDDAYEIFVVLKGRAGLVNGGQVVSLVKGMICVVEPGENHQFRGANDEFETLILNIKTNTDTEEE